MLPRLVALTALSLATLGCSTSSAPATSPPTTHATTTTQTSSTTVPGTTSTTVDPVAARRAEIEQIIQDVELLRRTGFFEDDLGKVRKSYANRGYYESTINNLPASFRLESPPAPPHVSVERLLYDSSTCFSVQVFIDWGPESESTRKSFRVYETRTDGDWGLSFVGTGFGCLNEHPFGSEKL